MAGDHDEKPSVATGVAGGEGSDPNDGDGQFNGQEMPTTDGQMASNTSEEVIPPAADSPKD
jgi:hypothetical protein